MIKSRSKINNLKNKKKFLPKLNNNFYCRGATNKHFFPLDYFPLANSLPTNEAKRKKSTLQRLSNITEQKMIISVTKKKKNKKK